MRVVDIIEKKRDNLVLTDQEISYVIKNYSEGLVPDYQMSALLMAIYFNGMNKQETASLTKEMLNSGDVIDLSKLKGVKLDKHSTGGVGDKTSLVVGPLIAACGGKLAKMSGRGLGHTGGTLDKLEAIEGFNIGISEEEFFKQVNEDGVAIVGQTKNLVPADKLLYALRDVTATVSSIPLIAASIMSKKLASGADKIVLDVKVGSGAFMTNLEDAEELAKAMVEIGDSFGKEVVAVLSNMDQPLGHAIGNALEVNEAIETLKGNGPEDFTTLCKELSKELLTLAGIENAEETIEKAISSGSAYQKFLDMVKAQGGSVDQVVTDSLPKAKEVIKYYPTKDGYITEIDTKEIGRAAMLLGAGRESKDDVIDMAVGLISKAKLGLKVSKEESIIDIHTNGNIDEVIQVLNDAIIIGENVVTKPIIYKKIRKEL